MKETAKTQEVETKVEETQEVETKVEETQEVFKLDEHGNLVVA